MERRGGVGRFEKIRVAHTDRQCYQPVAQVAGAAAAGRQMR